MTATYRYANLEGRWPLVQREGIEIAADGALSLARVPALVSAPGTTVAPVPGLAGALGVGASPCGDAYVADPGAHRILRIDGCAGSVSPLPCFGGEGDAPGQLRAPRGVAVHEGTLLVADSGNARIQLVDLATGQLRGVWDAPGLFAEPWDLAIDARGAVYVADPGAARPDGTRAGGRLRKLSASGRVDAAFDATLAAQPRVPDAPVGVTIVADPGADAAPDRLLVLDSQPPALLVYALDGTFDADATARWTRVAGAGAWPVAVIASGERLYVADAATGRVLVFDRDGSFLGVATGTGAAVAGLALDCRGRLVVHPGAGSAVQVAGTAPAFSTCGTFLMGPFEAPRDPARWWQVRATLDALPPLAHVRLFTLSSNDLDGVAGNSPDLPASCTLADPAPSVSPETATLAPVDEWRAAPWDAPDLLTLNAPARWLWIAGILQGDGSGTPTLRQLRIDFDVESWMRWLPAIYSRDETSRTFLERALALLEVPFDDEHQRIDDITRLTDPAAAPDALPRPTWLEWLATWVSAELEERWSDATRRRTVAQAFALYARRGTRETIGALVAMHTGVEPRITELSAAAGPWPLGGAALGLDSALLGDAPDGAVLGASAVVDHARLIGAGDYGLPAFADVAHRFTVQVYGAQLPSPSAVEGVRRVLDREKPAHTTYHLCVIEPRMRVGVQAAVGVDAIVGGPPVGAALDGTRALGVDAVLPAQGGAPDPRVLLGRTTVV